MKPAFFLAVAAQSLLAAAPPATDAPIPANWGQRKPISYQEIRRGFENPDRIYAPFIFWFWDEPLNNGKMAEMARTMCSQGFNPGYAHARNSMVGSPSLPENEWLHDPWFSSFDAALKEAENHHSYLGYCDEYWWPSFQAHGRVLKQHPELKAESLNWTIIDAQGGTEVNVPASFFSVAAQVTKPGPSDAAVISSKSLARIGSGEAFVWKAPAPGSWRVYAFNKYSKNGIDGGGVNCIDDRLAKAFIEIALEPYAKRMAGRLGKSIPGDFIDHEGDYGRKLAWSDSLDQQFKTRHGRDIRLSLPLMIDVDSEGTYAKARWEWFDLVSDLYAGNFQAVTDWHAKRGMYTTAHVWEESIPNQVNAVGDHMKLLRALTMPGEDALGQKALQVHDFKEIQSVAEFQNTRAMTELMGAGSFGEAGNGAGKSLPWSNFNPVFLKQAVNAVTTWGMSHIIPHGVFTTRKLTGNPWPPDWYAENPMFPYMHLWTDFARRACYINSMGNTVPNVLLYNPLESGWINTNANMLDEKVWDILEGRNDGSRIHQINKIYSDAITDLTGMRIEFLIGDRFYLHQMEVKNGALVRGNFTFRAVVLPPIDILTLDAARKITGFATSGGHVYALGEMPTASAEHGLNDPELLDLMTNLQRAGTFHKIPEGIRHAALANSAPELHSPLNFLDGEFKLLQQHRRIDGKEFFWLANNTTEAHDCNVSIRDVRGAASIWDCETGNIHEVSSGESQAGSVVKLAFRPLEAYWLVFDPSRPGQTIPPQPQLTTILAVTGPWHVTCDPAIQPTIEYPTSPAPEIIAGVDKSPEDWKNWLPSKFSGLLDYTKTIDLTELTPPVHLDLGRVCHAAEVWINDHPVGAKLWGPYTYDVSATVKPGKNVIRVRVANLINNSYGDIQESGLLGPVTIQSPVPPPSSNP